MKFSQLPYLCKPSYAAKWPTGVPYFHDQLLRQRRGKYWKQIVAVPKDFVGDDEEARAKAEKYQRAEYNHGYSVGHRGDCQDAEWYIGWLVHHCRSLNYPNAFVMGYIHGKHLRVTGRRCRADEKPLPQAKLKAVRTFAECRPAAEVVRQKPADKRRVRVDLCDIVAEALAAV